MIHKSVNVLVEQRGASLCVVIVLTITESEGLKSLIKNKAAFFTNHEAKVTTWYFQGRALVLHHQVLMNGNLFASQEHGYQI
jgi:hypothetical protein